MIAEFWLATMNDPTAKLSERLEASRLLADRGWGKPSAVDSAEYDDQPVNRVGSMLAEIDQDIERLCAELASGGSFLPRQSSGTAR